MCGSARGTVECLASRLSSRETLRGLKSAFSVLTHAAKLAFLMFRTVLAETEVAPAAGVSGAGFRSRRAMGLGARSPRESRIEDRERETEKSAIFHLRPIRLAPKVIIPFLAR